jgi:hypothetical protein
VAAIVLGAVFAAVGVGLLVTGAAVFRVVARQNSRFTATVAAGLFAGPGLVLVAFGLSLRFTGWV